MTVEFGTKAETLERLASRVKSAKILPQVRFTVSEWTRKRKVVESRLAAANWTNGPLIVRSSVVAEDTAGHSLAGHFTTVPNVKGRKALAEAIETVISSFDPAGADDQVFIQPMVADLRLSGVAFSRDPNTGGPYAVVNYDDAGGTTGGVTAGRDLQIRTHVRHHRASVAAKPELAPVLDLLKELDGIFGGDPLDIEFALAADGTLYLLQVRPLSVPLDSGIDDDVHRALVADIAAKIERGVRPHPYLAGRTTVYGVMPDWNPAEMIGIRPQPLALSLYRELITDATWAYQRGNYGYRNLRGFPLLISFHGLPYIDVRVSFNSFIPQDIDEELAARLVDYYVDRLISNPALHDKVEFEIVFSCYTLDLPQRIAALQKHGFAEEECARLTHSLRRITNRIIHGETGLWRQDRAKIDTLEGRRKTILSGGLDRAGTIYWLIEDCRRYGTLPFAGLARAGFIAVQLLNSLVAVGVLNANEAERFMNSVDTIGSKLKRDLAVLSKEVFLAEYGHLRPGTYDICSPRYDEAPDRYFDWTARPQADPEPERFVLSLDQMQRIEALLSEHGLEHDVLGLLRFIKAGIEGREYAKFVFSRSLSDALSLFRELGAENGIAPEDCAYADIRVIRELLATSRNAKSILAASIEEGKAQYQITKHLTLPPLLTSPEDAWAFDVPPTEPNYITQRRASGRVATSDCVELDGTILMLPNADPGYDWIFSRNIAALITRYGGVNSHMAIRAGELGVPAVIGAGDDLYNMWAAAKKLLVDCANRRVQVLK